MRGKAYHGIPESGSAEMSRTAPSVGRLQSTAWSNAGQLPAVGKQWQQMKQEIHRLSNQKRRLGKHTDGSCNDCRCGSRRIHTRTAIEEC